jgi:hypothetical protein
MQDMNADGEEQKPGRLRDRDFQLGCLGWFVVNVTLYIAIGFIAQLISARDFVSTVLFVLPFAANLGALIYFAFKRPRVAGGMLAAFGIALALAIVAGIILTIACFRSFSPNI